MPVIRAVWEQVSPVVAEQVASLERAAQAVAEDRLTPELQHEAAMAAHKLTGSLGSFGLRMGSRLARRIEQALAPGKPLGEVQGRRLMRLAEELRRETEIPLFASSSTPKPKERATPYASLTSLLADALLLMEVGGHVTFVNQEACNLIGLTGPELIGHHFSSCFTDPKYANLLLRTALNKGRLTDCELTAKTKSGALIPVSFNFTVVTEAGKTTICALGRNVLQQKLVEQELREQQAYTRGLIEACMDALVATDPLGVITDVNRRMCELTGRSRYELIGSPIKALFTEPRRMEECTRIALTNGEVTDYELTLRSKTGVERIVSFHATVFTGADGALRGIVGSARDISVHKWLQQEQRLLAEQLRRKNEELEEQNRRVQEANRLKSEFLANMSHELRTPLNSIIGFTELIHDTKAGPVSAAQKEFLGDILTSSRHLLHLIDGVLDLSKVEAGKLEIEQERVHLVHLVEGVTSQLGPLASQKQIRVDTHVDPEVCYVTTDSGKLKQVLYNYLSNALKFTPPGGAVSIQVSTGEEHTFQIAVSDTGIGIRPEDLPRLFVEFQQLDAGTGKRYPGTGLGLALTKRIMEAQGGRVSVSSTPGQGSTFYAILPRGEANPDDAPSPGALVDRLHILVVDGDSVCRNESARRLTAAGYRVTTVASGNAALGAWRHQQFDGMVLDLLLPDMSGYDIMQALGDRLPPTFITTDQPGLVTNFNAPSPLGFHVLLKPIEQTLVPALHGAGLLGLRPSEGERCAEGDGDHAAEVDPDSG